LRLLLLPLLLGAPSTQSFFAGDDSPSIATLAAAACPNTRRPPPAAAPATTPARAPREPRLPSCAQCRAPLLNAPLA